MPSVASAASVIDPIDAAELGALALELPAGWCVAIERFTRQLVILPRRYVEEWKHEVMVDPELRRVYAGLGWTARHTRDLAARAQADRGAAKLGGGTRRSTV